MNTKADIARLLLSIKAVFLSPNSPFTWASGIKSPIYCDNRLILSYPDVRTVVERALADMILDCYPGCEALMGTSTAGIPHAAIVAHLLGLPMGYVRSETKEHGRENRIEGLLTPGSKVVVVEDLISTAGSVIRVVDALRDARADVLGIASIFTYGMNKAKDRLNHNNIVNHSLSDFDTLVEVALGQQMIGQQDVSRLMSFRDNPDDEGWLARPI